MPLHNAAFSPTTYDLQRSYLYPPAAGAPANARQGTYLPGSDGRRLRPVIAIRDERCF